jgi:hypothetical protein
VQLSGAVVPVVRRLYGPNAIKDVVPRGGVRNRGRGSSDPGRGVPGPRPCLGIARVPANGHTRAGLDESPLPRPYSVKMRTTTALSEQNESAQAE